MFETLFAKLEHSYFILYIFETQYIDFSTVAENCIFDVSWHKWFFPTPSVSSWFDRVWKSFILSKIIEKVLIHTN